MTQRILVSTETHDDDGQRLILKGADGRNYRVFGATPTEKEIPEPGWRIIKAVREGASLYFRECETKDS